MTIAVDVNAVRAPGLAQRLADVSRRIAELPPGTHALVRLAYAFDGFYVARVVTVLLDAEATPRYDVFALAEQWCTQALDALHTTVEADLARRHCPTHAAGEPLLREITTAGQFELYTATDEDVARIGAEMINLAAELRRLLATVAEDESALEHQRRATRAIEPAAELIWSQYGGDGGGW